MINLSSFLLNDSVFYYEPTLGSFVFNKKSVLSLSFHGRGDFIVFVFNMKSLVKLAFISLVCHQVLAHRPPADLPANVVPS